MPPCPASLLRTGLAGCLLAALVAPALAAKGEPIFTLTDPRGDDHGDGALVYPLRDDMESGDLDLLEFKAVQAAGGTDFTATFANRVRPPGRRTIDIGGTSLDSLARYGFYTLNLEIYIDTDRQPGSGSVKLLPGRKALSDDAFAWEKAVCLVPRPNEVRTALRRLMTKEGARQAKGGRGTTERKALIREWVGAEVEDHYFFPTRIAVTGSKITFFVPDAFLGGPARSDWAYTVIVTAADIEQRFDAMAALNLARDHEPALMVLPIQVGRSRETLGGGREDDPLQPPIVDMLVPAGAVQEQVLGKDRPDGNVPVLLPGVVPKDVSPAK